MKYIQKTLRRLFLGVLFCTGAAIPAQADDVATVCGTGTNVCDAAAGTADINSVSVCDCSSGTVTLDFLAAGFGTVRINDGGRLETTGNPLGCLFKITATDLTVKNNGKIVQNAGVAGSIPGTIEIDASGSITVEDGGDVTITGHNTAGSNPTLDLFASGSVTIDGDLLATGVTTVHPSGHILIVSGNGLVRVGSTGLVSAVGRLLGGSLIDINACQGIEIFGELNADSTGGGAQVNLRSSESITVDGTVGPGKVSARSSAATATSTGTIMIDARDTITLTNAEVDAGGAGSGVDGGTIEMTTVMGALMCTGTSTVKATGLQNANGGMITMRSFGALTYDCTIMANSTLSIGFIGGTVLLQSFKDDVSGSGVVEAKGSTTDGTITLRACADPITDGGTFDPASTLEAGECDDALPPGVEPCCVVAAPTLNCTVNNVPNQLCVGTAGHDVIIGTDDVDVIKGLGGNDRIEGKDGNDCLDGGDGHNTVTATGGDNDILAGNGNDNITTGDGDDMIDAGEGHNIITTTGGANVITTGVGNDRIVTGDGTDLINAGGGHNTVLAGGGDDSISTENGNDSVNGEDGEDTCNVDGGVDTCTDCEKPDGLADCEAVLGGPPPDCFGMQPTNGCTVNGVPDQECVGGPSHDSIQGTDGDDVIVSLEGNDTVLGLGGNDRICGGTGHDNLNGGAGNDMIDGEDHHDYIQGESGTDTLIGGSGYNSLLGGDDDDTLTGGIHIDLLNGGGGTDTCTDPSALNTFVSCELP